ncbi:unnamed protein product [Gongylonema pulchrum]|uniref:WAP domain-containing protein n=1 Tax=Gongylonema pulchrum TaxID=637853 RepID=A0A183DFT8_9BILA|nr:unnamed protein product [Gongylonema pulchrum]
MRSGPQQYSATSSLSVQPTELVTSAQPISSSSSSYHTEPLEHGQRLSSNEALVSQKPSLGSSPPMEVNYQNGTRISASGSKTLTAASSSSLSPSQPAAAGVTVAVVSDELPETAVILASNRVEDVARVPSCPNRLKPMQYVDGRPVMCLPGRNQCPDNSVCFFNGVDFFCCPNAEDPYDLHVFGGYGGDEVKHGYKSTKKAPLNINELIVRKKLLLRRKRQVPAFSIDQVARPVRLDCEFSFFTLYDRKSSLTSHENVVFLKN